MPCSTIRIFTPSTGSFSATLKYNTALTDKASLQLKGFSQGYAYSADEANENGGRVINCH
ncbi:MAG: hypothetical protein PHD39_11255 [Methylobacter tundripaludum]|jgi:hypothetical protein|nr:hypothetical protein [Methylobacter tundripaludum]